MEHDTSDTLKGDGPIVKRLHTLEAAARNLRKAQRAYMQARNDPYVSAARTEELGRTVAETAQALDDVLEQY